MSTHRCDYRANIYLSIAHARGVISSRLLWHLRRLVDNVIMAMNSRERSEAFKSKTNSGCFYNAEPSRSEIEEEVQDDVVIVAECDDGAEKLQHFEGQLPPLSVRLEKLEERFELLEKSMKKIEVSHVSRQVQVKGGQLAFELNRAVVHKVLDGIVDADEQQVNSIGDMEKAFEGESNYDDIFEKEEDLNKAIERWESLKKEIGWQEVHYRFLKRLRYDYLDVVCSTFDREEIEQALKDGRQLITDIEMQLFKECLAMCEMLRTPTSTN